MQRERQKKESRDNQEELKECVHYYCEGSALNSVVETQALAFKEVSADWE